MGFFCTLDFCRDAIFCVSYANYRLRRKILRLYNWDSIFLVILLINPGPS